MTTKTRPILTAALLIAALTACSPAATPAPEAGLPQAAYATAAPAATQVAPHGASAEGLASLVPPGANRMVIKDATLSLEVTTLATAVSTITQLAADQGGYVLETSTQGSDLYQTASLRIAVPADRFESTLERLRTLSNRVLSEQGSGQDVSAEYVDLETRLNNLEATSARVREFLAEAKTVEPKPRPSRSRSTSTPSSRSSRARSRRSRASCSTTKVARLSARSASRSAWLRRPPSRRRPRSGTLRSPSSAHRRRRAA